jgi:hypothetical protein
MAKTSKRRHESTDAMKRPPKSSRVRDLLAKAHRAGGAGVGRDAARPYAYQHNQTDLEFLH